MERDTPVGRRAGVSQIVACFRNSRKGGATRPARAAVPPRPDRYSRSEKTVTGIPNRRSNSSSNPRSCQSAWSGGRSPTRMWSAWNAARASSNARSGSSAPTVPLACVVGCRSQPLEPSWQCRCDHQDLIGRIYELADSERQRVGAVSCLTGRDQQARGHREELITLSQMLRFPCRAPLFVQSGHLLHQPETLHDDLGVVCEGTGPTRWEPRDYLFAPISLVRGPPLVDVRKPLAFLECQSRVG